METMNEEKRGKAGFHMTSILDKAGTENGKSAPAQRPAQPPKCPECTSRRVWKDGVRYTRHGDVQRYLCRSCGYRFSDPKVKVHVTTQRLKMPNSRKDHVQTSIFKSDSPLKKTPEQGSLFIGKDVGSHFSSPNGSVREKLNNLRFYNSKHQVCVNEEKMKNLVKVETRQKQAAGATKAEIKGKIVDFVWWMKKQGYKPTTITTYSRNLNTLISLGANVLDDPESVKETLAKHQVDVNTKYVIAASYTTFLRFLGKTWVKPRYRPEAKPVFIPTDKEIQLAINSGHRESIAFVQLLYETGCRSNEAERIEWTDLDVERRKISVKASKNGKPRIITVSKELIGKLLSLPRNCSTIFPAKAPNTRRQAFYRRMKRLARVHNNPRFLKIHHHTFRHCKALREYHKTRSPLHVKKILGHRSLLTTQRYIELYTEIYGDLQPEQYVCETASTVKEAKQLIEAGYEYVNDMDGVRLYRKVKVT